MAWRSCYWLLLVVTATCANIVRSARCYDHQTKTYDAQFKPTYCRDTCTVTPFFSPDHSLDTYIDLIESATESIDIATPGK